MTGKKKLLIAVAAALVLVVGAVCIRWFFPDGRPVDMSRKELEKYWAYVENLEEGQGQERLFTYPDKVEVMVDLDADGAVVHAVVYEPKNDAMYEMYSPTEGYKYIRFRHNNNGVYYPPER